MKKEIVVSEETIGRKIYFIRGRRVMLDKDLAELYCVATGNLNKAVKRNTERFLKDVLLKLTHEEYGYLRFQIGSL